VCCVKFGSHILLPLFSFPASIFYSVCCNLFINKEKHKVVIYLGDANNEIFQQKIFMLEEIRRNF
jgi:hypothetical protein